MFGALARLGKFAIGAVSGFIGNKLAKKQVRAAATGAVTQRTANVTAGELATLAGTSLAGGAATGIAVKHLAQRRPPMPVPTQQVQAYGPGQAQVQMAPMGPGQMIGPPSTRKLIYTIAEWPYGFRGFVPNKSSYYRRNPQTGETMFIPAGTVWVRRRRMNSLNPRALDRSISRITSAKRRVSKINRITIRKG